MCVIKHILISFLNKIEYLLPMKPKSKALTIGGAWLLSNVVLFTSYCNGYNSIKTRNDYGRKQAMLPLIKEEFSSAATKNIAVYPLENEKNCPKTTNSEAVNVFLEQKLIGSYCLNRSIDHLTKGMWEELPLPYLYHSAIRLN